MAEEQTPETPAETKPEAPTEDLAGLVESLRADLQDARSEAAASRHKYNDYKRKHETEQERRDREAEERLSAKIAAEWEPKIAEKDRRIRQLEVQIKASALGFADPEYAAWLCEQHYSDQDPDKALATLLEHNPELARSAQNHRPLVTQGPRSEQKNTPRTGSWLRGR